MHYWDRDFEQSKLYFYNIFHLFTGNAETLKHEPKRNNIDTYTRLREFWMRYYSSHYMTLVVQSKGNITYCGP